MVLKLSKAAAVKKLAQRGLNPVVWATCSISNGKYQAVLCNYNSFMAIAVYNKDGVLLERFNSGT